MLIAACLCYYALGAALESSSFKRVPHALNQLRDTEEILYQFHDHMLLMRELKIAGVSFVKIILWSYRTMGLVKIYLKGGSKIGAWNNGPYLILYNLYFRNYMEIVAFISEIT